MTLRHTSRVVLDLLRTEGAASVTRRIADRAVHWSHDIGVPRRRLRTLPRALATRATGGTTYPLLNVVSAPLHFRSGLPLLVANRLAAEAAVRPIALLEPARHGWTLHLQRGRHRTMVNVEEGGAPFRLDDASRSCAVVILRLMDALGAEAVHVDGVSGLALEDIAGLAADRPLSLTVCDFGLYCPRPHLIESGPGRFCDYSQDDLRCARCLADGPHAEWRGMAHHRRHARALLDAARVVIFISPFLRRQHLVLFPRTDPARTHVVPSCGPPLADFESADLPDVMRVAFIGAFTTQKGAAVFVDLVQSAARAGRTRVTWLIAAGGDPAWLTRAKRLDGVRVLGFYRPGHLPRRLRRSRAGIALLLSISPEAYSETLTECFAAGIAVIAFDHGAIADRIRAANRGIDRLVPIEGGAAGVLAALEDVWRNPPRQWHPAIQPAVPSACAREYLDLYRGARLHVSGWDE